MPDDHGEREPDYRFTLANERTFLAWMRTSLALLAGGIALQELVEPFERGARTTLAMSSVVLSLVLAVAAYLRWVRVQEAMRRGEPLPRPLAVPLLAMGIAVAGGAAGLLVLLA